MAQDDIEIRLGRGRRARPGARDLFGRANLSTLMKLPGNVELIRRFLSLVNWKALHDEIGADLDRRIAIVGMPNAGKSTLFNTLRGQQQSAVSPEEGTTTELIRGPFGPFLLVDTPGHLPDVQREGIDEASALLMLLDATRGLRKEDRALLAELRRTGKPLVVALNKVDALKADPDDVSGELAALLGVDDIIPISARDGSNVAEELMPALMDANPDAAVVIGLALPTFRRQAANRVVRGAMFVSLAAGLEPIPLVDIPILLGNQIRMILRISALYGEPMTARHTRELGSTLIAGLAMRFIAEELAKLVPIGGDLVSGTIAAASTWAMGQVAIDYYENGKRLSRRQLGDLVMRYYVRYREERLDRQLAAAKDRPALVVAPARPPALPTAGAATPDAPLPSVPGETTTRGGRVPAPGDTGSPA